MKFLYNNILSWIVIIVVIASISATRKKEEDPHIPTSPYLLEYPTYFGNRINRSHENSLTQEGVYLGRMLFYIPRLSSTNAVSCATCHQQKFAFTDAKAFSLGVANIPTERSSMSLANLLWQRYSQ